MRNSMRYAMALSGAAALFAATAALSGCGGGTQALGQAPPPNTMAKQTTQTPGSAKLETYTGLPGTPIAQNGDPNRVKTLVASRGFEARGDPFSLFPVEVKFDQSQRTEMLLASIGNWSMQYEPPPQVIEEDLLEPQPYRRLAGVLIGETVSAIIIMEDGKSYIIKPGTKIPGSDWTVVSVDGEKAVLRREGNKKPNEITVRLETPPVQFAPPATGGGGAPGPGGDDMGRGGARLPGG